MTITARPPWNAEYEPEDAHAANLIERPLASPQLLLGSTSSANNMSVFRVERVVESSPSRVGCDRPPHDRLWAIGGIPRHSSGQF